MGNDLISNNDVADGLEGCQHLRKDVLTEFIFYASKTYFSVLPKYRTEEVGCER
jgi:hypothetical protein